MSFMNPYIDTIEGYADVWLQSAVLEDDDLTLLYDIAEIYKQRIIANIFNTPIHKAPIESANGLSAFLDSIEVENFLDNQYAFLTPYPSAYQPDDCREKQGVLYALPQIQTLEIFQKKIHHLEQDNYAYNTYPQLDNEIMQVILTECYVEQSAIITKQPFYLIPEHIDLTEIHPVLTSDNVIRAIKKLAQPDAVLVQMNNVARSTMHEIKKFIEEQQEFRFGDVEAHNLIEWNIRSSVELTDDYPTPESLQNLGLAYYHQGQVMRSHPYPSNSPRQNFDRFLLKSLHDEFEMNAYMLFSGLGDKDTYSYHYGSTRKTFNFQEKFMDTLPRDGWRVLRSNFSNTLSDITEPVRNNKIAVYPILAP